MLELLRRIAVALLSTQSPEAAAYQEAHARNMPELIEPLIRICRRESVGKGAGRCKPLRAHTGDAGASRHVYDRAVAVGWISSRCQPYADRQWSTRGSWGLMAAYHVRFLFPCAPFWMLDVPAFGAKVAATKLIRICSKPRWKRHKADRGWEGSNCEWKRRACARALAEKRSTHGCRWTREGKTE